MKIAVIGCGNMAWPIVNTICKNEKEIKFFTYTPSQTRAKQLAKAVSGVHVSSLDEFPEVDLWIIACKPQQLQDLASNLKGRLSGKNIISILASTSISSLENALGTNKIIRIMPNTPSALGKGISLLVSAEGVTRDFESKVFQLFQYCGEVIKTKSEKDFDELTVFSGSGPAYVFRFALAYFKKLIDLGYDEAIARKLVDQLFLGSSELMKGDSSSYQEMVDKVTSKGGVTIEAINILEQNSSLDNMVGKSIDNAILRGREISNLNN